MVNKLKNQTLLWQRRRNTRKKEKNGNACREKKGNSTGPGIMSDAVINESLFT